MNDAEKDDSIEGDFSARDEFVVPFETEQFILLAARRRQIQVIDLTEIVSDHLLGWIEPIIQRRVNSSIDGLLADPVIQTNSAEFLAGFERLRHWYIEEDSAAFPTMLYASLFASAYHFLEHDLNAVCDQLRDANGIETGYTDEDRNGIRRAMRYLNRVVGVGYESDGDTWRRLTVYGQVRNLVAHNGGLLDGSPTAEKVRDYIEGEPTLDVTGGGRVVFSRAFVVDAADTMREFWLELYLTLDPDDESETNGNDAGGDSPDATA